MIKNIIQIDNEYFKIFTTKTGTKYKQKYIEIKCLKCGTICYKQKSCKTTKIPKSSGFCSLICKSNYFRDIKQKTEADLFKYAKSADLAYLAGLIASDGSLFYPTKENKQKGYRLGILLHRKDSKILLELQKRFGGHIYYNNMTQKSGTETPLIHWVLCYKPIVEYYRDVVGINMCKSLNLNIKHEWFNNLIFLDKLHFMRGLIDGDGHINTVVDYIEITSWAPELRRLVIEFIKAQGCLINEYDKPKYKCIKIRINSDFVKKCGDIFTLNEQHLFIERKSKCFKEKYCQ